MNEDNQGNPAQGVGDKLSRLQPAGTDLDPRVVFYEAGFAAGRSQTGSRGRVRIASLIAACLLAIMVTVPVSYYAGQTAANQAAMHDSVVAAQSRQPQIDAPQQHDAARMIATPESVIASETVEAIPEGESKLSSHWFSALDSLAASVKLDREASKTLSVFHASLVSRGDSAANWTEFPFPIRSTPLGNSPASAEATFTHPLAVSDLHEVAISLEAIR